MQSLGGASPFPRFRHEVKNGGPPPWAAASSLDPIVPAWPPFCRPRPTRFLVFLSSRFCAKLELCTTGKTAIDRALTAKSPQIAACPAKRGPGEEASSERPDERLPARSHVRGRERNLCHSFGIYQLFHFQDSQRRDSGAHRQDSQRRDAGATISPQSF